MAEPTNKPGHIRIVSKTEEAEPGNPLSALQAQTRVYFVRALDDGTERVEDVSGNVHGVSFRHICGNMSEVTLMVYDAELLVDGADKVEAQRTSLALLQRYAAPQRHHTRAPEPKALTPLHADALAAMPLDTLDDHLRSVGLAVSPGVAEAHQPPRRSQFDGFAATADGDEAEFEHAAQLERLRRQVNFRTWAHGVNAKKPKEAQALAERLDALG